MTQAQREALKWLAGHTGDGCFDKHGVFLAAGELAPHVRATWNALASVGLVEFYRTSPKGYGRMRITEHGREVANQGARCDA